MEDATTEKAAAPAPSLQNDDAQQLAGRTRSDSASSGHKRSSSGSLLSRLSFLRMMQAGQNLSDRDRGHSQSNLEADDDRDDLGPGLRGGRPAMSTALQQRKTRRRRGSLRKTALLGTRFDYRDKKGARPFVDITDQHQAQSQSQSQAQTQQQQQQQQQPLIPPPIPTRTRLRSFGDPVSPSENFISSQPSNRGENNTSTWTLMNAPQRGRKVSTSSTQRLQPIRSQENVAAEDVTTDDEDIVLFPRKTTGPSAFHSSSNTSSNSGPAGLRLPTPSLSTDSYYSLQTDQKYRTTRAKSPLATHAVDLTGNQETIGWDYSETEWWGWIILIVTWLVFTVGMGSCFGVWSWAWDVGETPYAPPELEDDPTLPIVGYYPALIILTAVMSWVWVVVAWVGMKYFKHANITGDDT